MITLTKATSLPNVARNAARNLSTAVLVDFSDMLAQAGADEPADAVFAEWVDRERINARYAGLFA